MGGGMQAVRPQLFAQEPSRRLSAGQVEAYLYIWSLAGVAAAGAGRLDSVLWTWATGAAYTVRDLVPSPSHKHSALYSPSGVGRKGGKILLVSYWR